MLLSYSSMRISCLIVRTVTIHIYYNNLITGENSYSKLSLVDTAGSEGSIEEDDSGEHVTDLLHVMKSFSAYVMLDNLIFFAM
jgi:hypothetical protein